MTTRELLPLLLDSAVKGTVILALAALAAQWLRRGSAASRHLAWQLGLIGLLALPVVSALSPWQLEVLPFAMLRERGAFTAAPRDAGTTPAAPAAPAAALGADEFKNAEHDEKRAEKAAEQVTPSPSVQRSAVGDDASAETAAPAAATRGVARVLPWLVLAWAAGALLVIARYGIGLLVAQWYTRRSRPLDAVEWASLNETMSFAVGLGHPVRLLKSERASTPMTFGVLDPVVLLPADADEWPEERRRIVLLHELAHVQRMDCLTHVFAQLACALYWFNPLVWMAAARMRAEGERACDDWVLRAGMRASTYADHLLDMVRTIGRLHTPAAALPMAQRSTFEGRLLAILEPGMNRNGLRRGQALALTLVIGVVVVPLAAMTSAPVRADALPMVNEAPHNVDTQVSEKEQRRIDRAVDKAIKDEPKANVFGSWVSGVVGAVTGDDAKDVGKAVGKDVSKVLTKELEKVDFGKLATDALKGVTGGQDQLGATALNALITALGDTDVEVRRSSAHSLGEAQDPRAIAALSNALRTDKDPAVRRMAAWGLGNIEDARGVPALSDALKTDTDVEVRRACAWALGNIESPTAVEALTAAMRDSDREVRKQALWALGQIEDVSAVPALQIALRDTDADVRRQAVWALGEIEHRGAVPAVITALRDSDAGVRETAVWALGQIESEEAVTPLVGLLNDPDAKVRKQAVWALGEIESRSAVDGLSRVLREDKDAGVRETAAWALGQIEDQSAVPALAAALKDTSPSIRQQAAWALGQIEHRPAPQALLDALRDENVEVKRTAAWALGQIEDPAASAALRGAMRDTDPYVKRSALRALSAVRDSAALDILADMLKDPDPEVRRAAAAALGGRGFNYPDPRPQPRPQPRPMPQPRPHGW